MQRKWLMRMLSIRSNIMNPFGFSSSLNGFTYYATPNTGVAVSGFCFIWPFAKRVRCWNVHSHCGSSVSHGRSSDQFLIGDFIIVVLACCATENQRNMDTMDATNHSRRLHTPRYLIEYMTSWAVNQTCILQWLSLTALQYFTPRRWKTKPKNSYSEIEVILDNSWLTSFFTGKHAIASIFYATPFSVWINIDIAVLIRNSRLLPIQVPRIHLHSYWAYCINQLFLHAYWKHVCLLNEYKCYVHRARAPPAGVLGAPVCNVQTRKANLCTR